MGSIALARLTDATTSILLKRVDWGYGELESADKRLKGMFENSAAWPTERIAVCFLDIDNGLGLGEQEFLKLKADIAAIASEWNAIAGVPDFDFGTPGDPNRCAGNDNLVAVEITERPSGSMVGQIAMPYARIGIATMNLQLSRLQSDEPGMFRHLVLHEFGHALGLLHEIRHADGNCWEKFDEEKLYAYYAKELKIGDRRAVKSQLRQYDRITFGNRLTITSIDQPSVMMYAFPKSVYRDASPPCWSPLNTEISAGDRLTLQKAYRVLGVGAMQLASLASGLDEQNRRVVDAYIALQTAPPAAQGELILAMQRLDDFASAKRLADAVFATAHSPAFQTMLIDEEMGQAAQSD